MNKSRQLLAGALVGASAFFVVVVVGDDVLAFLSWLARLLGEDSGH